MNTKPKTIIDDKVILFRIRQTFSENMRETDILEVTRKAWVVGKRRNNADYALAVVNGKVVAAFTIVQWYQSKNSPNRWEFEGEEAPDSICEKYVDKNVEDYFMRGNSNPVLYVNC